MQSLTALMAGHKHYGLNSRKRQQYTFNNYTFIDLYFKNPAAKVLGLPNVDIKTFLVHSEKKSCERKSKCVLI